METNRTLAYAAVFAAAVALAHSVPGRWSAVLGAITLSAVAISAYAVLTKVFPGALNPDEIYARLREPFGYWNSVGLAAALGVPGCLWLGSRRGGHQGLNALAYPALGLLVLTMLLSFSRGAVLAAVLGAAFWFATVPRRLRGAAVLIAGSAGGGLIALWAFSQNALTDDRVPVDLRNQAGLQLGLLLIVTLVVLAGDRPRRRLPARLAHADAAPARPRRRRAARRPRAHPGRRGRRAVGRRARPVGLDLRALGSAHRPVGVGAAAQRQQPPDRGRQRARALLGRGAADLRGQRRRRRRGGRLRDRPQALPHGRRGGAPRARLRRADRRRPRPRRARRQPRAARRLAGERGARHRAAAPRSRAPVHPGADRAAHARRGRDRLRRALVRRLDVVRARQRRRRAARRRLGRGPRAAGPGRGRTTAASAPAPARRRSARASARRAARARPRDLRRRGAAHRARDDLGGVPADARRHDDAGRAGQARPRRRRGRAHAGQAGPRRRPALAGPAVRDRHDPDGGGPQFRGRRCVGGGSAPAARQPRPVAATRRVRVQYVAAAGGCAEGHPPGVVPRPPIF